MDHCGFNAKTDGQICKTVNNHDVINGERRGTQTHTGDCHTRERPTIHNGVSNNISS